MFIFKPHDVGESFTVLVSVVLLCGHLLLTEIIVGVWITQTKTRKYLEDV